MGQKWLSSTFKGGAGYESFQWQPLIASHDPNPPITLEDNYLNGIEWPDLGEYDLHLYEPSPDFQQAPLSADIAPEDDINRTEAPTDLDLYTEEEPQGETAAPPPGANEQPYPTEQPEDLSLYETDPEGMDDLLTQLRAPYVAEEYIISTVQPDDLDRYSDEEPQGESAAPLAPDNDVPYPVEFPESFGEYDPEEVQEGDIYTQLQAPLPDPNEQPYPVEEPVDLEFYVEEEPQGDIAAPLAGDNEQPYPTEAPASFGEYDAEEVLEADLYTQLQSPRPGDNEQPYPWTQPEDIELYAEEEPQGEAAAPLADDNDVPYPTEQPADFEPYIEEEPAGETEFLTPPDNTEAENEDDEYPDVTLYEIDPDQIDDLLTQLRWPLPDDNEQPYPTEEPRDLDLYDPFDWVEEGYTQVFWLTPEDDEPPPTPIEDSLTITFGELPEEPEGSVFWLTPPDVHSVSVVVAVAPVLKDGTLTPFTVVVWDGFLFADADFVPASTVFKITAAGPLLVHDVPVLVKRPATIGLYDGTFTPSVIAVGGAPEVYLATADVTLADDTRRWGTPTMAIGPCPP